MMMRNRILTFAVVAATACAASACSVESSSQVLSPTSPSNNSGGSNPPSTPAPPGDGYLGTWQSAFMAVGDPKSCTNLQWTVSSQTSSSLSGTFSATCPGGVTIEGSASGQLDGNTVTVTATGKATLSGAFCDFSLSGTGTIAGDALTIPYTGHTCLGPVEGTEVLR